jgi:hypothetical protein
MYIPQEQVGPVISLGTGFPFRRLLPLAGLRWGYSNLLPRVGSDWLKQLNYKSSLNSPSTDPTENVSSIIACFLVTGETCPQSCSLAMAVVLSLIYAAVTWQWVYVSVSSGRPRPLLFLHTLRFIIHDHPIIRQ